MNTATTTTTTLTLNESFLSRRNWFDWLFAALVLGGGLFALQRYAAFMDGYAASVEAANSDLEGTAALCEQYGVVAKAALAQKALPQCNIVFETGDEMKTDLETYFKVLYAADPASVGGALPADDFYYAG